MRAKRQCWIFLGLFAFVTALAAVAQAQDGKKSVRLQNHFPKLAAGTTQSKDRTLDTAIHWETSVRQAAEKAQREGKLVFVIHVSGDFEDPEFT